MNRLSKAMFGSLPSGERVDLYTLRNSSGVEAAITTYGGRVVSLKTPDRNGKIDDVVLGFDKLDGYWQRNPYLGAIVGRYANRIADGQFRMNGITYKLARNNGTNSLHGGLKGFDKVVWNASEISASDGAGIELKYVSPDGEEGYPGNLDVTVRYLLTDADELNIEYTAVTDKDTQINLTNHSYFDLSGQAAGNILDHVVTINADRFTPVDERLIPTGELRSLEGTPFDFRKPAAIGARIGSQDPQLKLGDGYDHNFVLNRKGDGLSFAARVIDPKSGRVLETFTTEPGLQFYTGNHLDGTVKGKGGIVYGPRFAFCLETQHFPDSPNQPDFPSTVLKAGDRFQSTTVFKFSAQ